MANPLARQVLNHMAQKAGETGAAHAAPGGTPTLPQAPVQLNPHEEKLMMDLIHLRQTLYPGKKMQASQSRREEPMNDRVSGQKMVSLSELAGKNSR
ncbi:hypothetical protein [Anoxynatronum sibiricum]|uniref:Uncharacterized protein n=1 Tax=Anoxynatronum sibiricum TaxID=210623 RepID=A0ABU9VRF9_9CLOT